jgi:hypothetical protein
MVRCSETMSVSVHTAAEQLYFPKVAFHPSGISFRFGNEWLAISLFRLAAQFARMRPLCADPALLVGQDVQGAAGGALDIARGQHLGCRNRIAGQR